MGRWAPDARGRIQQAAAELFTERGYDRTTTADIAERAGLTERTYFRHFADKREVLFDGTHQLESVVLAGVRGAPAGTTALDAVTAGLVAGAELLQTFGEGPRHRAAVIAAHPELQERELAKMARMARGVAAALVERGVPAAAAGMAAEAGVAVLRVAFERWVTGPVGAELPTVLADALAELRGLCSP